MTDEERKLDNERRKGKLAINYQGHFPLPKGHKIYANRQKAFEGICESIVNLELKNFAEVMTQTGIGRAKFNEYFPKDGQEFAYFEELIDYNVVSAKMEMRRNWATEDAPAQLQLAHFKLMASIEELARLGAKFDIKSEAVDDVLNKDAGKLTDAELERLVAFRKSQVQRMAAPDDDITDVESE